MQLKIIKLHFKIQSRGLNSFLSQTKGWEEHNNRLITIAMSMRLINKGDIFSSLMRISYF